MIAYACEGSPQPQPLAMYNLLASSEYASACTGPAKRPKDFDSRLILYFQVETWPSPEPVVNMDVL